MNFLFNIPSFASVLKKYPLLSQVFQKISKEQPPITLPHQPLHSCRWSYSSFINLQEQLATPYHCNLQEGPTPSCHKCTTTYNPRNLILFGLHCNNFVLSLHPQKGRQASVRLKQLIVLLGLGTLRFLVLPEECWEQHTSFIYC